MKWLPWTLLAGVALWLGAQLHVESGLRERIAERQHAIDSLGGLAAHLRQELAVRVPEVDTLIQTRWRAAVARVDTLHDSVPYPVVRGIIAAGDTTIRACRATLSLCEQVAATERARAEALAAQAHDWQRVAQGPVLRAEGQVTTDPGTGHWYVSADAHVRLPILDATGYGRAELRLDSLSGISRRVGIAIPFRF